jgi:cephalosporin hydroxylase
MIPLQLHRRIPLVRRPFYQRDRAIAERDYVMAERDRLAQDRDRFAAERDSALAERDGAIAEMDHAAAQQEFQSRKPGTSLFAQARKSFSGDVGTKPPGYYLRYDQFFHNNHFTPKAILEIGVHQGESTKIFARVYPDAKIVAFDLKRYDHLDFSDFPNITYLAGDQTDKRRLEEVIKDEFPAGFDLVIEDASHIGAYSHATFHTVFPHLKPGGIYIVEDWGTGYFDDFPDGGRFQEYPLNFHDGNVPKRLPSHDFGMVGFVKSLVDLTSEPDIRDKMSDPPKHKSRIETLEFSAGICIAKKALS